MGRSELDLYSTGSPTGVPILVGVPAPRGLLPPSVGVMVMVEEEGEEEWGERLRVVGGISLLGRRGERFFMLVSDVDGVFMIVIVQVPQLHGGTNVAKK